MGVFSDAASPHGLVLGPVAASGYGPAVPGPEPLQVCNWYLGKYIQLGYLYKYISRWICNYMYRVSIENEETCGLDSESDIWSGNR